MLSKNDQKGSENVPPCRACMTIRLFLMGVASIALIALISPSSAALLKGAEPLSLAIFFVGFVACIAIIKAGFELAAARRKPR